MLQIAWLPSGCPILGLLTDRGTQYISHEFTSYVTQTLKANLIHTSAYYPQGNGINEASHQLLHHAIKTQPSTDWTKDLPRLVADATLVHNASPHPRTGRTPFEALFHRDAVLPGLVELTQDISEDAGPCSCNM
jgi:transposase InsO family protein